MCKRRGYCSERDVCKDVAQDMDTRQGGNIFKSAWFNFGSFHDANKPHKAGNKAADTELDGCACHWVGERFENLLIVTVKRNFSRRAFNFY